MNFKLVNRKFFEKFELLLITSVAVVHSQPLQPFKTIKTTSKTLIRPINAIFSSEIFDGKSQDILN